MKTFLKVLWVISGIALIVLGIYCLFKPAVTLVSLSFTIGLIVLFNGISAFVHYFTIRALPGSTWLLLDGILSTLFGILLLFTNMLSYFTALLPMFFSIWIIIVGIFKLCNSFDIKKLGNEHWYLLTIVGVLCILLGILMWLKPIISAFAISIIVGVYLIFAGISTITSFGIANKIDKLL